MFDKKIHNNNLLSDLTNVANICRAKLNYKQLRGAVSCKQRLREQTGDDCSELKVKKTAKYCWKASVALKTLVPIGIVPDLPPSLGHTGCSSNIFGGRVAILTCTQQLLYIYNI